MRSSPRWRAPPHKQDFKPCWTEAFKNQETWTVVWAITLDGSADATGVSTRVAKPPEHDAAGIVVSRLRRTLPRQGRSQPADTLNAPVSVLDRRPPVAARNRCFQPP